MKLSPSPPALVEIRHKKIFGSTLNSCTKRVLSAGLVPPSKRLYTSPLLITNSSKMLSSWNNVIENTSFGYTAFMFFRNLERTYTFFFLISVLGQNILLLQFLSQSRRKRKTGNWQTGREGGRCMLDWHLLGLPVALNCRNGEKLRKLQAHGPLYGPSLMRKARFLFSLPIFQRMNVNNQKMNWQEESWS